jgi:hypothetical protein
VIKAVHQKGPLLTLLVWLWNKAENSQLTWTRQKKGNISNVKKNEK